jgi:protein-arginine deiminase
MPLSIQICANCNSANPTNSSKHDTAHSPQVGIVLPIPGGRFPNASDSANDLLNGIHIAETCLLEVRLNTDDRTLSLPLLAIEVDLRARGKVQLFRRIASKWSDLGCSGRWLLDPREGDQCSVTLGVVARAFRGANDETGAWDGAFILTVSAHVPGSDEIAISTLPFLVAPYMLASSLDPVEEVLVVSNSRTADFVEKLQQIIPQTGARLRSIKVPNGDELDVWVQDAVEIGRICVPLGTSVLQAVSALGGIRALSEEMDCKPLDSAVAHFFEARRAIVIDQVIPRAGTGWIDWFGNLEVSPPVVDQSGRAFPCGRILTGAQKTYGMHPEVLEFLEAQHIQGPPLVLDTSWLTIGHVDEVVSFIPANGNSGFRVLVPNTELAWSILKDLRLRGYEDSLVFANKKKRETTVAQLLDNETLLTENTLIQSSLDQMKVQLCSGLGLKASDFVELPALFQDGISLIPNFVNSLVINGHALVPTPAGPVVDGQDVLARWVDSVLHQFGIIVHFIDDWEAYHCYAGEIHCGTNCIRRVSQPRWWEGVV